ncbi:MAG: hypothetical protein WAO00_14825 [Chthoniobacterales bacterium]
MDDSTDYIRWFEAIFRGQWLEIPIAEPVPGDIANESREWAALLLEKRSNPCAEGKLIRRQMFLGLKMAPDKLVTTARSTDLDCPLEIVETLQHFVVGCPHLRGGGSVDGQAAETVLQTGVRNHFSAEAKAVVATVLQTAGRLPPEANNDSAVLLSPVMMPISAITRWSDQVGLFWFAGKFYLDFPKAYSKNAVAIFKTGLDWYPSRLRTKLQSPR